MTHRERFVVLVAIGVVLAGAAGLVAGHDTKTVNGYELTFGGSDEPVITGERTWLELRIVDAETEAPVAGQADNLSIAVQRPFGNDTFELEVDSRFGQPGWYEAPVVFTEPGTYTVYVNGTVDGDPINTTFSKQVHNASRLEYPAGSSGGGSSGPTLGGDLALGFGLGAVAIALVAVVAFVAGRRW